jgi:hypothetical protein
MEAIKPLSPQVPMKQQPSSWSTVGLIAAVAFVVLAGVSTGYALAQRPGMGSNANVNGTTSTTEDKPTIVGSLDKEFKDETSGMLEVGGMDGEGTHHLLRDGGPSQTVYLTSSVINLDDYTGKKVKVWGQTFSAQKAGWLMDVGKLEVLP